MACSQGYLQKPWRLPEGDAWELTKLRSSGTTSKDIGHQLGKPASAVVSHLLLWGVGTKWEERSPHSMSQQQNEGTEPAGLRGKADTEEKHILRSEGSVEDATISAPKARRKPGELHRLQGDHQRQICSTTSKAKLSCTPSIALSFIFTLARQPE